MNKHNLHVNMIPMNGFADERRLTRIWNIAGIPIQGRVILAPMEGITDHPYRMICRKYGASSLSISEFINAIDIVHGHPYLVKNRIHFTADEKPMSIQIFDHEPARLIRAAQIVMEWNPDLIDINMGCSVKKVSNRGAGAGLLRTPAKIIEIFSGLSQTLPIPITGKIRLGWDESTRNYLEVARILEDNGAAAIAVHARTRSQGYSGKADWEAIAEIKSMLSIPVIGNGDITGLDDIHRMFDYTKCDAVMIGRAAIGNPWIFSPFPLAPIPTEERIATMLLHLRAMVSFYGERAALIQFRKHAVAYLSTYSLNSLQRKELLTTETFNAFQDSLSRLMLE